MEQLTRLVDDHRVVLIDNSGHRLRVRRQKDDLALVVGVLPHGESAPQLEDVGPAVPTIVADLEVPALGRAFFVALVAALVHFESAPALGLHPLLDGGEEPGLADGRFAPAALVEIAHLSAAEDAVGVAIEPGAHR
mgnify:FL=1